MKFFSKISQGISRAKSAFSGASSGFGGFGRFFDASDQYTNWVNFIYPPRDFQQDAQKWDFNLIVSASRRLYANCGIAKIIDDKAMYAVGRAWLPRFTGTDRAWGKLAYTWLVQKYYPIADVRGRNYDFQTNLHLDSVNMDVSGDFGKLLTKSDTGWPQTQRIPSHRINSGDNPEGEALIDGPYQGLIIRQGVIYNKYGRPVAYGITTDTGWETVSARDMIHTFDPSWYDQGRGLPILTPVLEDMKSLKKTQGFEQQAMEILSNLGLIEENPEGHADPSDPANRVRTPATPGNAVVGGPPVVTQTLFGGLIKYFKANSGSKLSTLQHGRPGPNWESFWDRIIKGACISASWSYEYAWKLATLGGAALRAALSKINRAVEDRQDVLKPGALQEIQYALACAINLKELPESDEWFMWAFTLPARITADIGREAQQDREDYKLSITTLSDILEPQGITAEEHYRRMADDLDTRKRVADETGHTEEDLGKEPRPTVVSETFKN